MIARDALAERFRDWLHGTELSLCSAGADECPDWPLAYELADLALEALAEPITREEVRSHELARRALTRFGLGRARYRLTGRADPWRNELELRLGDGSSVVVRPAISDILGTPKLRLAYEPPEPRA